MLLPWSEDVHVLNILRDFRNEPLSNIYQNFYTSIFNYKNSADVEIAPALGQIIMFEVKDTVPFKYMLK